MKILSIDIGITNLGYVYTELDIKAPETGSKYKNLLLNSFYEQSNCNIKVLECDRVDITNVHHRRVRFCDCKLLHERCIPDYLDHFVQEHPVFEECDVLLLERQPPFGITNVQDLLFTRFREKVKMLNPNSFHVFFNFSRDYEMRKIESTKIANNFLNTFFNYNVNERKHDISDALIMIIYYRKIQIDKLIRETCYNKTINFDEYKYK
jgi:hypothetical protein